MPGLLERLAAGPVICAEGYLFELERRGYLQAGAFVPEVVLDHPEQVVSLHEQLVHAGSDVVEAFTYYAHREKLRQIGKEHLLESMNRRGLTLAAEVAARHGALLAGNVCNTNVYHPDDAGTHRQVREMFDEQVRWAVEGGVDFVIAETIRFLGEAELALQAIKAAGLTAVVTLVVDRDEVEVAETRGRLERLGHEVVGLA
jgi:betaine-homocysteine S-methyltransferase